MGLSSLSDYGATHLMRPTVLMLQAIFTLTPSPLWVEGGMHTSRAGLRALSDYSASYLIRPAMLVFQVISALFPSPLGGED